MKDYRTWWRKGYETYNYLHIQELDPLSIIEWQGIAQYDEIREQLWAIREGLA